MKPRIILIPLCLLLSVFSFGQQNHVFLEVGGAGLYGSLNYERLLVQHENYQLGGRIGLSTFHLLDHNNRFNPDLIIPVSVHFCYGKTHFAEVAIGNSSSSIVRSDNDLKSRRDNFQNFTFFVGYRYQNKSGFTFRAGYSPILENYSNYLHWGALSFGYRF